MVSLLILCSMAWTGCGIQENHRTDTDRNEAEIANTEIDTDRNEKNGSVIVDFLPSPFSYSEQKVGNDTIVCIGSLTLTLPKGWQIEARQEDGMTQYVLVDVHSQCENEEIKGHKEGYEHEIMITPYEIPRMPEDTLQLAAAMKEHFTVPVMYGLKGMGKTEEIKGGWMYGKNRDTEERKYFLFSGEILSEESSGGRELFYISENTNTDYRNEVESFAEFLDNELVWIGDEPIADCRSSKMEYYYSFNRQVGGSLFAVMERSDSSQERDGAITVYQQGNYDTPIASLSPQQFYPDEIKIVDIDRDGNDDFVCRYWLLNPLTSLSDVEDEKFDGYLWYEEQNTFLYAAGDVMLARYGDLWERKNNLGSQRGAELIPEGLIAYLSEHLMDGEEELRNAILQLVSERKLTIEEVQKFAEDSVDIKNEMLSIVISADCSSIWLQADADNDGIEDIYLREFLGGTMGYVYYYLFTGREDGSYELTDGLREGGKEFYFIDWEGKNYLVKITYDFSKKVNNGISIECYENGIYQGGDWLTITPKEGDDCREINTSYLKEGKYRNIEEKLLEFAWEYQIEERIGPGTAENVYEEDEYINKNKYNEYMRRSCDLDNDGEDEDYQLEFFLVNSYYTVSHIKFYSDDEEINTGVKGMLNEEDINGIPMNMWIDKTEYGNMIFILYEEGLYDFHICGWLMSENGEEKVIQVDCKAQTEVTKNVLSKETGW